MVRVILYNNGCKTFESKGTEFNSTVTYNLDNLDYCIDNADLRQADFKYLYLKDYSNLKDVENLSTDDHRNIFLLPEDIAGDIIINGKKKDLTSQNLFISEKIILKNQHLADVIYQKFILILAILIVLILKEVVFQNVVS